MSTNKRYPAPKSAHTQLLVFGSTGSSFGGVERGFVALVKQLVAAHCTTIVTATNDGTFLHSVQEVGGQAVVVPMNGRIDTSAVKHLTSLMRTQRPETVHINFDRAVYTGLLAILLAKYVYRVPIRRVLVTHHTQILEVHRGFWRHLLRRVLYRAARVESIFVSAEQLARFEASGIVRAVQENCVIENSVDTATFRPVASPAEKLAIRQQLGLDLPANATVITCVSGYRSEKRHLFLLQAFCELVAKQPAEDIRLVLVGYGPEESRIRAEVEHKQLAGRVILTGRRYDVADILRASDIAVHVSDREGFALATLEEMATGLPLVCTENGSAEKIFNQENGILLNKSASSSEVAEALALLLASPEYRANLGAKARLKALEYSVDRWVEQMQLLYRVG